MLKNLPKNWTGNGARSARTISYKKLLIDIVMLICHLPLDIIQCLDYGALKARAVYSGSL